MEAPSHRAALIPFGINFWDDPTHVRPYSVPSLKKLFEIGGLEIVDYGVKKSIAGIMFGLPYMIIGLALKDQLAKIIFPTYLLGLNVYSIAKKR